MPKRIWKPRSWGLRGEREFTELEQGWVTERLCQGGPPCGHACACRTSLLVWKRFSLESAENPPPTPASCGCPPLAETGAGHGCRQTAGSLQRRRGRASPRTGDGASLHPSPLPCGPTSVWWGHPRPPPGLGSTPHLRHQTQWLPPSWAPPWLPRGRCGP